MIQMNVFVSTFVCLLHSSAVTQPLTSRLLKNCVVLLITPTAGLEMNK